MGVMQTGRIAIIPARGGSKRLPRKNILPVNGHPVIAYPIRAAKNSGLFDDVVVSTEDDEIAEIGASQGATIIARPDELARDQSTVVEVCSQVLNLPEYRGMERFCCIYATALFVTAQDISNALEVMDDEPAADYVMGVSEYNYPPVQALKQNGGYLQYMWPEYRGKQSQEYPELVVSNGTIYWANRNAFMEEQSFYGRRLKGYRLPAVDIDTPADYKEAKRIAEERGLALT